VAVAAITFDHLGSDEEMRALRDVVERHGVPATFFVTGQQAAARPGAVAAIVAAGHEVGVHGWAHEKWSELDAPTEHDLLTRCRDAIGAGLGFRAPGGARTNRTSQVLAELGYAYDASLGDGMTAARLDNGVPNVPFVWPGVDGYWYLRDQPADPSAVRDAWLAALDKAVSNDTLFLTICHPEITGDDDNRLAALDVVVGAAAADARIDCQSVGAIAARIPA
jgi:peptidoglycan/xylan/chitin deacetylase (PgdA/CDA1 family)